MSKRSTPSFRTRLAGGIALLVLVGIGFAGWNWWAGLTVLDVEVHGHAVSLEEDLLALARVQVGELLSEVDPLITSDRVRRHPWVKEASAARQSTGQVRVEVRERRPVALVVNADGDPTYYLDRFGYQMPFVTDFGFAVPLIRGVRAPYRPTVPVKSELLLELLDVLPELDVEIDALVSEYRLDPTDGVMVTTVPTPTGRALSARLGETAFVERMGRLHAFWHQAVLPRPHTRFDWIDLRFDSQIVTREHV